jgi:hypothetical protein
MMRLASSTKPMAPNDSTVMSRTNERLSEAGASPSALANRSARMPKIVAVSTCPTVLAVLFRPRLRARRSPMKSSRNPTIPSAVVRNSTSSADAVIGSLVSRWETT